MICAKSKRQTSGYRLGDTKDTRSWHLHNNLMACAPTNLLLLVIQVHGHSPIQRGRRKLSSSPE
jgi:hypothetical protein